MTFTKILENDLKKSDKRGLATLYLYWLENGKKDCFDLPLFISDDEKGVLSVEVFKRVFYAFQLKAKTSFKADIKSGDDGDESKYNVVRITKTPVSFTEENVDAFFNNINYVPPTKSDVKRESSKITNAKAKAKKQSAEETAKKELDELNAKYDKKVISKIADLLQGKYKMKFTSSELATLENELSSILVNAR